MNDKVKQTKYSNADKHMMLKLFDLVENVNDNVSLANKEITQLKVNMGKNNVILEQHHVRSTNLEGIVEKVKDALDEMVKKVSSINTNVSRIDKDLEPIEKHVTKVERWIAMVQGVPAFFKIIMWLFVFITSSYGCYSAIVKWLN
ncbi:MAG: hypothetical protein HRU18_01515 [Pseudoalteromonas sp.]|uniref:hypothetical protein n=1 Tax=Pseudoalteromonas sp. TaxID=53249 RepID=UPI001D58C532|nr:hypothetical protein [Pseudoalteromonas sp.]NRA76859.1 hypothetical protein [Pseudoalteromonas sp.]